MAELDPVARGGLRWWESPSLRREGFVHAFSTRTGGASTGAYASLNLGRAAPGQGDRPEDVAENHRRFAGALGVDAASLHRVRQVHGAAVHQARGDGGEHDACADALIATEAGHAVMVRTADCVPVLLACPACGAVAAVHAGWRGLLQGVLEAAVAALRSCGAEPGHLLAAIGPCIGPRAFEVGEEVAGAFHAAGLRDAVGPSPAGGPRPHVDLPRATRTVLARAGVHPARMDGADLCTWRDADAFFSYRRDGAASGRMASLIQSRAAAARTAPPRGIR